MIDFLQAFTMIFIAEMGDKTQIMAMAFAMQFSVRQILMGVGIGSFLNHGIAILLGAIFLNNIPLALLNLFAGLLFIFFGYQSLSFTGDEESMNKKSSYGGITTVALAFFIGELGDKTQLTALSLSTQAALPLNTLLGSTVGMVAVSSVGIFVGTKLGNKVPEPMIKSIASTVFVFFGLLKVFSSDYIERMPVGVLFLGIIFLGVMITLRALKFREQVLMNQLTAFKRRAQKLKELKSVLKNDVDALCKTCLVCDEKQCLIKHIETLLSEVPGDESVLSKDVTCLKHEGADEKLIEGMLTTMQAYYELHPELGEDKHLVMVKKALEHMKDHKEE